MNHDVRNSSFNKRFFNKRFVRGVKVPSTKCHISNKYCHESYFPFVMNLFLVAALLLTNRDTLFKQGVQKCGRLYVHFKLNLNTFDISCNNTCIFSILLLFGYPITHSGLMCFSLWLTDGFVL